MERKKTLSEIVLQASRLMQMCDKNQNRRDKVYSIFCDYRGAIYNCERYWRFRHHIINSIEGTCRGCITGEVGNLTKAEKDQIAARVASTTVEFTRLELFVIHNILKSNERNY